MGNVARWSSAVGVFFLLALVACLEPRLVRCGAKLCPAGSSCVADELCVTHEQIAACDGLSEGDPCTVAGSVGYCDRGACVASGCGNHTLDPEELCDDGNAESGDGCRADCRKVEMCGDGIVDSAESCDDGNTNPADGCDGCIATAWRPLALIGGTIDATSVALANPQGVAVDRDGYVYIADSGNHRIRRIDPSGVITTVAGNGLYGFAGDGAAATSARLGNPLGVAIDGLGNLYIADTFNGRVRRVDPSGVITTIAGTGTFGSGGDGGLATSAQLDAPCGVAIDGLGNVYVADLFVPRIRRIDTAGVITTVAGTIAGFAGDGGPATSARMSGTQGVEIDAAGNLYIADTGNNRVRKVDPSGVITTIAGTGSPNATGDGGLAIAAGLTARGLASDGQGNLFVADVANHRIRRIDTAGIITTTTGTVTQGPGGDGGLAIDAQLSSPNDVAVDDAGTVFIADRGNHRVRRVDGSTAVIDTVAGTGLYGASGDGGAATSAQLVSSGHIAIHGGDLYIADRTNHLVRRVDSAGVIATVAGIGTQGSSGDGGAATAARLSEPIDIAADGQGNLFIADKLNHRIRRIDGAGIITTIAGTGTAGDTGDGGPATLATLSSPTGVAVDAAANVYIADRGNHRIRRIDAAGAITTIAGTGTPGSSGDGGAATNASLSDPTDVALDASGNLYIADTSNQRVRKVDPAGVISTIAGTGTQGFSGDGGPATLAQLFTPSDVTVDGAGAIYIADAGSHHVRKIDSAGIITTIAGNGTQGNANDGADALAAQLGSPNTVAVDSSGNVYVGTPTRIRRVSTTGIISTAAGAVDPEGMGPFARARLPDPQALVVAPQWTFFAGGTSGTLTAAANGSLAVVAGRYFQPVPTASLARFRDTSFGTVGGLAYDAATGRIYLTETSANKLHVIVMVDPANPTTWTIETLANASGFAGFVDGAAANARFRAPTGLYLDADQLYVADTGNHAVRAIDLAGGAAAASVRTVAGTPATRGFFGDGGLATSALLYAPRALTRCANGDWFVADTGNHRVRRIASAGGTISTVLGNGIGAPVGDGSPSSTHPVQAPLGLACDPIGNLYVTSTTTVRQVVADASGSIDGSGVVQTIYGTPPRDEFPASATACLSGLAAVDPTTLRVVDSCAGLLVELVRENVLR